MRILILSEERWKQGGVVGVVRCGVYASFELAKAAAEHVQRASEAPRDPENYSFLVEEDVLVRRASAELVTEPGRSWRWWPELAEEFAAV